MARTISSGPAGTRKSGRVRLTILAGAAVVVAVAAVAGVAAIASPAARPGAGASAPAPAPAHTTTVTISATRAGDVFSGIGAISGGGGNSRYLVDYPEPQRSQILDYLFKPHYGASLQMLKLEIGGDANSSDGSEPSIEHSRGSVHCGVGYEWWLAQQALARNPRIKLYGLQWTAPGWTADSHGTLWTSRDVGYVIDWLNCAKSEHLTISYLGGWDEAGYSVRWYKQMRAALDAHGYRSVQLVAPDGQNSDDWSVARTMARDKAFRAAVSVLGEHDSCAAAQYSCPSTKLARSLRKPLWLAELGGLEPDRNAANEARAINRMHIDGRITALLQWPLVSAMPAGVPHQGRGLVIAAQPWSGNYTPTRLIWATAQTTQFVQPGWRYVRGAGGSLGSSGSADAYVSPGRTNWTVVAENTGSARGKPIPSQRIRVRLAGKLKSKTVHVWATNLRSGKRSKWFVHAADIRPVGGQFTYTIPRNYVVTFTTTTGQSKAGSGKLPKTPGPHSLPLPYTDPLSTGDLAGMPRYLAPSDGSFELAPCLGQSSGACLQQTTPAKPVLWHSADLDYPYAILGDPSWSNYTVSVKALMTQSDATAGVIGRFSHRASRLVAPAVGNAIGLFKGYLLDVTDQGAWKLLRNRVTSRRPIVLASGRLASPLGVGAWHTLSLTMNGSRISASIDGRQVASATDRHFYRRGLAGVEAGAFTQVWPRDQYRDLSVTPA